MVNINDEIRRRGLVDKIDYSELCNSYRDFLCDINVFYELGIEDEYSNPSEDAKRKVLDYILDIFAID